MFQISHYHFFFFFRHPGIPYIAQTSGLQGVGSPKKGFYGLSKCRTTSIYNVIPIAMTHKWCGLAAVFKLLFHQHTLHVTDYKSLHNC